MFTMSTTPRTVLRQLVRYAGVGVLSTVTSLVLYAMLRTVLDVQTANVAATLAVGVANAATNRRYTFGAAGGSAWRFQLQSMALLGMGLALSACALAALESSDPTPARTAELAVVTAASLAGGLLRFTALRILTLRMSFVDT